MASCWEIESCKTPWVCSPWQMMPIRRDHKHRCILQAARWWWNILSKSQLKLGSPLTTDRKKGNGRQNSFQVLFLVSKLPQVYYLPFFFWIFFQKDNPQFTQPAGITLNGLAGGSPSRWNYCFRVFLKTPVLRHAGPSKHRWNYSPRVEFPWYGPDRLWQTKIAPVNVVRYPIHRIQRSAMVQGFRLVPTLNKSLLWIRTFGSMNRHASSDVPSREDDLNSCIHQDSP